MNKERYFSTEDRAKFFKLINPYMDRLRLIQAGKGRLTNKERIESYKLIFDEYVRDPKSELLNIGCNACISSSIDQTIGRWERETVAEGKGKRMTFPKQEPKEDLHTDFQNGGHIDGGKLLDSSKMKWGAFKKYCTSKGIKVTGKNRKKLEEELKGL